jgi:hypothetical protein
VLELFQIASEMAKEIFISSTEILRKFGEKAAYSLAQGQ